MLHAAHAGRVVLAVRGDRVVDVAPQDVLAVAAGDGQVHDPGLSPSNRPAAHARRGRSPGRRRRCRPRCARTRRLPRSLPSSQSSPLPPSTLSMWASLSPSPDPPLAARRHAEPLSAERHDDRRGCGSRRTRCRPRSRPLNPRPSPRPLMTSAPSGSRLGEELVVARAARERVLARPPRNDHPRRTDRLQIVVAGAALEPAGRVAEARRGVVDRQLPRRTGEQHVDAPGLRRRRTRPPRRPSSSRLPGCTALR